MARKTTQSDAIVMKAKLVIKYNDLTFYDISTKSFYDKKKHFFNNDDVKKMILNLSFADSEQNYVFINKVLKQIILFLY